MFVYTFFMSDATFKLASEISYVSEESAKNICLFLKLNYMFAL